MVGWHHRLDGHEFEQAPGVGDGQGSLACCSPWGCKELDSTERLNWLTHISNLFQNSPLLNLFCSFSILFQTFGFLCLEDFSQLAEILQVWRSPFSRGSSQSRDQNQVSHTAGRAFTSWATREAQEYWSGIAYPFSCGSSQPGNRTGVSCITGRFFTNWSIREVIHLHIFTLFHNSPLLNLLCSFSILSFRPLVSSAWKAFPILQRSFKSRFE